MRVVIADDHRVVRDGLRWMLAEAADVEVVGEASDGTELLGLLEDVDADVVLLDVSMPGVSGLDALEELQRVGAGVQVIMLSMHDKPVYVKRAIELGAAGYLLKSAGRDEVLRALRTVHGGDAYIQGEVTGPLLRSVVADAAGEAPLRLSARQVEVLTLVSQGAENKQIATALGVSEATVKTYLKSIFARLDVRSRAEAVAVGLREGLIE